MGSGAGNFIKVLLRNFDVLAGPVVSLVYPLHASVRAIETQSHADDKQWLTYWVLYSLLTLFELTFAKLIEWVPIWSYAKLILTCWLVIPYFSGAAYVYEHFVRPVFVNPQSINIWYVPKKMDIFRKPDDVLTAAEKYIAENGPDAFEKILSRSDKSRRYKQHETMYVLKESLRLHPPGPLLSWARLSTSDVQLSNGMVVPKGTTAMVNMWAITHDPTVWSDPLQFNPDRFTGNADVDIRGGDLRLAPFGAGRRVCPGKNMGLATVTRWVAELVRRFEWSQDQTEPVNLSEVLKLSCEMEHPLRALVTEIY